MFFCEYVWVPDRHSILQQWADEDFISFFLNVGGNVCVCVCKSEFVRVMVRERDRQTETETNRQRQRDRQRDTERDGRGGWEREDVPEEDKDRGWSECEGLKKGNWRGWDGGAGEGMLILMWCNYCYYYPVYKFVSWHNKVFYILGKF